MFYNGLKSNYRQTESLEAGHRVYTLELFEIKKFGGKIQRLIEDKHSVAPNSIFSLNKKIDDVNNCSKVVDENGEPLVVHHGTENGGHYEFDAENFARSEPVTWFDDNNKVAYEYARNWESETFDKGEGSQIYSCFLNMRNPIIIEANGKNYMDIQRDLVLQWSEIELSSNLIELLRKKKSSKESSVTLSMATPDSLEAPIFKDIRLLEILQGDSSKVVDENGEPLVVWHGGNEPIKDFSNRNASKEITSNQYKDYVNTINKVFNVDWDGKSEHYETYYFANSEERAKNYGYVVQKFFLNIRNPRILPADITMDNLDGKFLAKLKSENIDGAIGSFTMV